MASRTDRLHNQGGKADQRTPFQRDRDRVLHSYAFRRLAEVTQVVGACEGYVFHNRLTHSLKVAQIARRLAERLGAEWQEKHGQPLSDFDPDVVETAALAHDLGHPPYGHVGEVELNRCAEAAGLSDGFEGNAQSFRILTALEVTDTEFGGLNLTRASLNAVLKYPWYRAADEKSGKRYTKWGAYQSEGEAFEFARRQFGDASRALEAQIMDYADEVAYSVHDFDDFRRIGRIPLEFIAADKQAHQEFLDEWAQDPRSGVSGDEIDQHREAIDNRLEWLSVGPYRGTVEDRALLRRITSALIAKCVMAPTLSQDGDGMPCWTVPEENRILVKYLQRFVWKFVICDQRLATQQHGQKHVVRELFNFYLNDIMAKQSRLVPPRFERHLEALKLESSPTRSDGEVRLAVDIVAALTGKQAGAMYRRLTGVDGGSLMDLGHLSL